jgi:hypothetical protein
MPSASNKLEKSVAATRRLCRRVRGLVQTELVMSKEMRLTVPATVTVRLDDAIGQLGELKELLSLLGHTFHVEVEIERDRQIDELDRRILGDAKMVAPHPAFRP